MRFSCLNRLFILTPLILVQNSIIAQTVRCIDATDKIVAYAHDSYGCPSHTHSKASTDPISAPTAAQTIQAQNLAQNTHNQADMLEKQRLKQERENDKALAMAQNANNIKHKRCKKLDLTIQGLEGNVEQARLNGIKKGNVKVSKGSKQKTATAIRVDDAPSTAAYVKAKRKLELAQAKRDIDCK